MSAREIDPALRIGAVTLGVSDVTRSAEFYERVLGLSASEDGTRLGAAGEEALVLTPIERPHAVDPRRTGLFHVAWLHPSRAALAATVRRVIDAGWRFTGASDHGVSEALYLDDPDGLGIEIYVDRPREQWERPADGKGVVMVTQPLDVEDLLAQDDGPPDPDIAPGTHVGHVHMKVSDVPRATAFYRDSLGFALEAAIPSAAFLGAGGYHHHVAVNSWQSAGASRAGAEEPGLALVEFELPGAGALDVLADALPGAERDGAGVHALDPDGQPLLFSEGAPAANR
ncbi:MAG TPA: VOC family protein [Solirubrobacteraceae bacterium]|nr:VOC family protein [Solirubrobacteraceae bacterium]